jgi:hypothetical protein
MGQPGEPPRPRGLDRALEVGALYQQIDVGGRARGSVDPTASAPTTA